MARKNRTVADRKKSLEPMDPDANLTLSGAQLMYKGIEGEEFHCTISGYCRTRIFEFPRTSIRTNSDLPHYSVYDCSPVKASIVSNLVDYFTNEAHNLHYSISPSLRHVVGETYEKIKSQQKGRIPVFLVVEEYNELTPVEMVKGECSISDEVCEQDGEKVPCLIGGREGEKFITAWHTVDGAWPELPNNQQLVNMILAGVRIGQETSGPIRKHMDMNCLVTDNGRFVVTMRPTVSARAGTATVMDTKAYQNKASEIKNAIVAMERDTGIPHIALLINSMYCEEYKDDAYQRLQYLQLWQSLAETRKKYLNSKEDMGKVVAGKKTLQELKEYRDDIAHGWTDTIDESFLDDLQRTINELLRRKYF